MDAVVNVQEEEQPLFQTKTVYTYEEFLKYNQFYMKKKMVKLGIAYSWILLCSALLFLLKENKIASVFLLFCIISIPLFLILSKRAIKKQWEASKTMHNRENEVLFYAGKLQLRSQDGYNFVSYENVYEIKESNTNFYIFLSINQAILIVKDNCSQEIITFLQDLKKKIKKQYYKNII